MTRKTAALFLVLLGGLTDSWHAFALDVQLGDALTVESLRPHGTSYEATVPNTLDLAERAKLSVHALTAFLNARQNYAPYGHAYFNVRVPYMTSKIGGGDDGSPNWGRSRKR